MAPAQFAGEMPNSCRALTGAGFGAPASIHRSVRPHLATNLGQPNLIIIWMATRSKWIRRANRRPEVSIAARYCPVRRPNTVEAIHLFRAQRGKRCAHQLLDMTETLSILDWQGACCAITGRGLLLAAKFCIEVAARQLK